MKTPNLSNAVEMSELSADFEVLGHVSRYHLLFTGDYAKVCVTFDEHNGCTGERFWVKVTFAQSGHYQGIIHNDLAHTEAHGLRYGDPIAFDYRHIYNLIPQAKLAEYVKENTDEQKP